MDGISQAVLQLSTIKDSCGYKISQFEHHTRVLNGCLFMSVHKFTRETLVISNLRELLGGERVMDNPSCDKQSAKPIQTDCQCL